MSGYRGSNYDAGPDVKSSEKKKASTRYIMCGVAVYF